MFGLDAQIEYIKIDIDYSTLKNVKAVIIGGHERWQAKMKDLLPNFIFIHIDMVNFDVSMFDSVEFIFIYTNYLTHSIYYKAMDYVRGSDIKVHYLKQQNIDLVLKDIQLFVTEDMC